MQVKQESLCMCTVTSPDFVPGTMALIHSFLKHNPWFAGDIVIISDGLEPGQEELFAIFPRVKFYNPGDDLLLRIGHLCNALPELIAKRRRFYSIEIFNLGDYDRLLFFDSDMLVMGDISEALSHPAPLLACSDQPNRHVGKVRSRKSFKRILRSEVTDVSTMLLKTFNAGFFVVGKKLLNQNTYNGLKDLIHINIFRNIRTHNTDQVVLNLFFDGVASILPFAYNMIVSKWPEFLSGKKINLPDIKVLHFTGNYKPWEPDSKMNDRSTDPAFISFYKAWHDVNDEVQEKISRRNSQKKE
ncbi:MAG: hypothetical protein NT004_00825 [Bacteroidetes bacterium]|nr:hypothetical protein [Bacteroidota bacterium]